MPTLPSFASITILNCGLDRASKPCEITLQASQSFPACPRSWNRSEHRPVADDWAAKDKSNCRGSLVLQLRERISEGRSGSVYAAQVKVATDGNDDDVSASLPAILCLKFAKQQFCRSIAREAWFYERLAGCQGAAIPRCFGFFKSSFHEQQQHLSSIVPWEGTVHKYVPSTATRKDRPSLDRVGDDNPDARQYHDERGFKRDSPWNSWNYSEEDPTITVLLLEKLGEPVADHWLAWATPPAGLQEVLDLYARVIDAYPG